MHEVLRGPSAPLDDGTRNVMGKRLGADLSHVRVHADERAAASALAVNAAAYTVGSSIVFGKHRYAPHQEAGRSLLAHELIHTLQQSTMGAPVSGQRLPIESADSAAESQARAAASARDLGGRAYTAGNHIVCDAGQYAPTAPGDRHLLVHELAHVAQHSRGGTWLQKAPDEPAVASGAAPQAEGAASPPPTAWKAALVNALARTLGLPSTAVQLAESFGEGVVEQLAKEGPAALTRFAARAAAMEASDYLELTKGYLTGVVGGIVSPVTDLFGLAVFAEKVMNAMTDVVQGVFNNAGRLGAEVDAVVASARKLIQGAGQAWETIKKSDPKQLVLGLLGLGPLPGKVDAEARKMGHSAGSAIIAGLESPWQKEHGEPEAPRDWLRSPLAAIESKASELEKRWIGEVPWAKVGASVGYAVGFAVIQVILFVFTEGIGNAIEQAAVGLGRLAGQLGKLGKAIGAAAEVLAEIGRGVDAVGSLIEKVIGAALKPLEKLLKPVLEPLTEMLQSLRTLLRKLLGVAEKEAPRLEQAAAKTLGKAEKHVPVPGALAEAHPPAGQPSAARLPTADVPPAHAPTKAPAPIPAAETTPPVTTPAPTPAAETTPPVTTPAPTPAAETTPPVTTPAPTPAAETTPPVTTPAPTPAAETTPPVTTPAPTPAAETTPPVTTPAPSPAGKGPSVSAPEVSSVIVAPDNSVSVKIVGEVGDPIPNRAVNAPNYNRQFPSAGEVGLPANYQEAHLWGPGFDNEQASGMMLAPQEVNLRWQADVEGEIRDLRAIAKQQGGHLLLEASAESYPRTGGFEVLKEAEYRFRLVDANGREVHRLWVNISVGPPRPACPS